MNLCKKYIYIWKHSAISERDDLRQKHLTKAIFHPDNNNLSHQQKNKAKHSTRLALSFLDVMVVFIMTLVSESVFESKSMVILNITFMTFGTQHNINKSQTEMGL